MNNKDVNNEADVDVDVDLAVDLAVDGNSNLVVDNDSQDKDVAIADEIALIDRCLSVL